MSASEPRIRTDRDQLDEARIDSRRYLAALGRSRALMVTIIVIITGGVVGLSLKLPKTYDATAGIVLNQTGGLLTPSDAESTRRTLATLQTLLESREVQGEVAKEVPGETAQSIAGMVDSTVDADANVINVTATDRDPDTAAEVANATATAFLKVQGSLQRERIEAARQSLLDEIDPLQSASGSAEQIAALRRRIGDLGVQAASAGSDLQFAERADLPETPARPRPVRNGILAFFASLFLGILVALGRDQLRPRVHDSRELGRMTGLRVLGVIPYVGRRLRRRRRTASAAEHEAYQSLAASLQLSLPPNRKHVILVTSATPEEGKSTVTARLGRALTSVGHPTLLISGDIRWPTLHNWFDLPVKPGLSDALQLAQRAGVSELLLPATAHDVTLPGQDRDSPTLQVLTAGTKPRDPGGLLSSGAAQAFFRQLRDSDFTYCLIDAPPALGTADVQALAVEADAVILVARLDRTNTERVLDIREFLENLNLDRLGLIVIGAGDEVSPYYLSERQPARSA